MKEETNKKVYDFIKGNIINLVIVLTGLAYLFYGMVGIEPTGLTIASVVAKAGIGIVVGFIIKEAMGENGFNYGYRSDIWKSNRDTYLGVCNTANNYIERVDNFYLCEEIEKKKKYRRQNLVSAQMKYDWFFDKDGNYINRRIWSPRQANKVKEIPADVVVLTRYQKKILRKCLRVKIYNLNLFSEYGIEAENDTKKERTDKNQRRMMFGKNGLFTIVGAIAGAYFIPIFSNWSWAEFIQSSIQVMIWISCGAIQLYTNFNYICVEKVAKLKRKSELIIKFRTGCENGLYINNPYDEMEEKQDENEQSKISSIHKFGISTSNLSNREV